MKYDVLGIIVIAAMLMITATAAHAIAFPMIISGEVTFGDTAYAYQTVKIKDLNLNHEWIVYTNENGRYQITLNNFRDDLERTPSEGDLIQIDVCPTSISTDCRQTVTASYDPQDISFGGLPEVAKDDSAVKVGETPVTQTTVSPPTNDCEVCEECPESEPKTLWDAIIGTLAGLGVLGVGVGIKAYRARDGSNTLLHKHPGIIGYHDPTTQHRKVNIRHSEGELTPKYEKVDGIWQYQG